MAPELAGLVLILKTTHRLVHHALAGVTEAQAREADGACNPLLWVAAHTVVVRASFLKALGVEVAIPWAVSFRRGEKLADVKTWPAISEVIARWDEVHAAFMTRIESLTSAELAAPITTAGLDKTLLGAIGLAALHDSYHVGQLGTARRRLGLSQLVG